MIRLFVFALAMAAGQILFKKASLALAGLSGAQLFAAMATNRHALAGVALYGGATVLWILVLRDIRLSQAYPFVALGFVLVPMAAHFVFGEALGLRFALGSALILAGIFLSTSS